jgi:hypothetical protein
MQAAKRLVKAERRALSHQRAIGHRLMFVRAMLRSLEGSDADMERNPSTARMRRRRLDQNACTAILLPLVLLVKRPGMGG